MTKPPYPPLPELQDQFTVVNKDDLPSSFNAVSVDVALVQMQAYADQYGELCAKQARADALEEAATRCKEQATLYFDQRKARVADECADVIRSLK